MKNRRTIIILVVISLIGLLSLGLWRIARQTTTGGLDLTVVPNDATMSIDGSGQRPATSTRLTPGRHTIKLERNGFAANSFTVEAVAGQTVVKRVVMHDTTEAGRNYYKDHPDEATRAEDIAGTNAQQESKKINANNPLIQLLPYQGRTYSINYGKSNLHPDDPTAIAIYIRGDQASDMEKALTWIRAQGYDPKAYEIVDFVGHD